MIIDRFPAAAPLSSIDATRELVPSMQSIHASNLQLTWSAAANWSATCSFVYIQKRLDNSPVEIQTK